MSFADSISKWTQQTKADMGAIRQGIDAEMFRSIRDGSEITGAPGQPVETRRLYDSWKQEQSADETVTSSDAPYAAIVEENVKNTTYANHGPHSVKLTVAGVPRIIETVAQGVAG